MLAFTGSEKAAEDVGFDYAANVLGRFFGTLMSGLLYRWDGLLFALAGSVLMLEVCWPEKGRSDRRLIRPSKSCPRLRNRTPDSFPRPDGGRSQSKQTVFSCPLAGPPARPASAKQNQTPCFSSKV